MTAEDVYSDETLDEVFSDEDEIHKAKVLLTLEDRAAQLGVKTKFTKMVSAYKKVERQLQQAAKKKPLQSLDNWTNFDGPYDRMYCGSWIAREDGIWVQDTGRPDVVVCYHPILPVERLKNLETGEEQLKLAYKRNGKWEEIIVPKTLVTSANKIVALSGRGIAVTSENAKLLVRYLSDVENLNEKYISVQYSSSKLGWIRGGFLPYDTEIVFDGDSRFKQAFESIQEHGCRERWYDHVKELRATGRIELKFMLAASFASVLLPILGGLPFFVDLWGEKEGVKTAYDFTQLPGSWVRKYMTVVGERTWKELKGIPCITENITPRKQICTSRSFGQMIDSIEQMDEAVSTFASTCAKKLREQKGYAVSLLVFIITNRFREDLPQYWKSISVNLPVPTDDTLEIVHYALSGLRNIFLRGYQYKKAGVIITEITYNVQRNLFDTVDRDKRERLMNAIDSINGKHGHSVKLAVQGQGTGWKLKQEQLSKHYTTNLGEIIEINCK